MIEPVDDDWWKHGPARDSDDPDVDDNNDPVVECPHWGEEIFDDAVQCPACGWWIVRDRRAMTGKPDWFVWPGIVGVILAVIGWIVWH